MAFTVGVSGTAPLSYQWRRGGTSIVGATNSTYTIAATATNDHGATFAVVVTNTAGSVTSVTAVLLVDPGFIASQTNTLIALSTQSWRYDQSGSNWGTAWKATSFNDGAWSNGLALLGAETTPTVYPEPFRTTLKAPNAGGPITTYYRTHFTVPSNVLSITLVSSNFIDDGVLYWINGAYAGNLRVTNNPAPDNQRLSSGQPAPEGANEVLTLLNTNLVPGDNVLAAEVHQYTASSSDVVFGVALQGFLTLRLRDTTAPTMQLVSPASGSTLEQLTFVSVTFDEAVTGVQAADLLINGTPATNLLAVSDREFQFNCSQPLTGVVTVAWASAHGITDTAMGSNAFAGGSWSYTLNPAAFRSSVVISEFMADNAHGLEDEDGARSDWLELYNPGPIDANLDGWFLTDTASTPAKWRFPAMNLGANKYLLVWASSKNRTNPAVPLHTNFKLGKSGSYLGLYDAQTNVLSEFTLAYPAQTSDISYGRDRVDPGLVGFFSTPTPGAQNSTSGTGFTGEPVFSLDSGVYTNDTVTLTITATAGTIRYAMDGSVPTTNSTVYAGPLTFGTNATIRARAFQTGLWPSPVVARNYVFLDSTARDFTSNLPLLIMNTAGRAIAANVLPGAARTPGSFFLVNTNGGRSSLSSTPQAQGLAEFEIFGQTSAGFPKKPYNIEIQDELGNDLAVSLLGMPAEADWKLRNPYSDKCMMNDFLGYELFEKMGHYSCRRRFVEVFVASTGGRLAYPRDYSGIEVLFEKIERGKDRVDIAELTPSMTNEPSISGGYMFKKDKDSAGDLNFSTSGGNGGFTGQALKIHEPKPREITTAQVTWIQNYLNQFEQRLYATDWLTATGTNHYSYYIDTDSFADMHWIVEFAKQVDGYRLSDYMQKDRNGKVKLEPVWDWNLSFGNANYQDGGHVSGWYYPTISENQHIWLRRLITGTTSATSTSGDPDFNQKIADHWGVFRTNVFNGTNLNARIDEIAAALSEAASRDFAKFPRLGVAVWPNPNGAAGGWDVDYQNPTTYAGIISEMKNFVMGRYLWIDSQFTQPPALNRASGLVAPGSTLTLTAPAGATIYYTLNGSDPRLPGGSVAPGALSGTLSITVPINTNLHVMARARAAGTWNSTWSGPSAASLFTVLPALRITEIMYHPEPPPAGNTNDADNFEFVELRNTGANTLSLVGFRFTNGIDFTFTATNRITSLAAGERVLVVKNFAAFALRYPTATNRVAGEYGGSLNNAGEQLFLEGPLGEPILDFAFSDAWYPVTDGQGFSLVVVDDAASPSAWANAANWRASTYEGGSPGTADAASLSISRVLVSELLNHPDPALGQSQVVELFNSSTNSADLSGWYLTDNASVPKKYRIPNGTVLPAGAYLLLYETDFNPGGLGFSFSAGGEEAWLFSADTNGVLTGYSHGFNFGAAEAGVSFGRYVNSQGDEDFVAQSAPTFGGNNATPRVGPVVISEIMYHPQALTTNDPPASFIELLNIAATNVPLFHAAQPTNTWHLRSAADFNFPTNVTLPSGGTVLVVAFDPATNGTTLAAFRSRYGVATNVPIYGPWQGSLPNDEGVIELKKPDSTTVGSTIPYVTVEQVHYHDAAPWPEQADGWGASLARLHSAQFANEPTNWTAALPSAGTNYPAGLAPGFTTQPQSQAVMAGTNVTLSAAVSGNGPFAFQWSFNGAVLPGATNATLTLTNVQLVHSGSYQVLALNPSGSALSAAASLTLLVPVAITSQPQGQSAFPYTSVTFAVGVTGAPPIAFQWRRNGANVPGATNASLVKSMLPADAGDYTVLITNAISSVLSEAATLTVFTNPIITVQPQDRQAVVGSNATFSVTAASSTPLHYAWYFNTNTPLAGATNSSYSIPVIQSNHYGLYSVQVSDSFGSVWSDEALLAARLKPSITQQPQPTNSALRVGESFTLNMSATGPTPLYFRWRRNGATLTNIVQSEPDSSYTVASVGLTNAGGYDVVVTNSSGNAPSSDRAYLTVMEPLTNQAVHPGANVTFTFQACSYFSNSVSTNLALKYRWYVNETNLLLTMTNMTLTLTNVTLTLTNVQLADEGEYRVLLTNSSGLVAGQTATLTILRPPVITQQPAHQTVVAGSPAYFAVSLNASSPLFCQWLHNGSPLSGFTAPDLYIGNVQAADAGTYSVIITNSEGSTTSEVATLTVLFPPSFVQQPASLSVHPGSNAVFSVDAAGTAPLSYQWWFNGTNLLPGATEPTFTVTNVQAIHGGAYHVVVSNFVDVRPSQSATLTVLLPPSIVQPPVGLTAECSSNATFTVVASGTAPLSYRWFSGTNLIPSATTATLTLSNVTPASAGQYSVLVTNSYGSAVPSPVTLAVQDTTAPAILACASVRVYAADATCHATLPNLTGSVTATDTCGTVSVTQNPPSGTSLGLGVTTVTFTVLDGSGNEATCATTVTVLDQSVPVILSSFTNLTLTATSNGPTLLPNLTGTNFILATDNCASVTVTQSVSTNTPLVLGTNRVVLAAFDAAGNAAYCTNFVRVIDQTPPVLSCPSGLALQADTDQLSKSNVIFVVTATDNLAVTNTTCVPPSGSTFPLGTNVVHCTAADSSGNNSECHFNVTVLSTGALLALASDDVNCRIPDGSPAGLVSMVELATLIERITNVTVTLNLTGGFNGDLQAYLVHDSGHAILLNRVGKTMANPSGYSDAGFSVLLDDLATNGDIHHYRVTLSGNPNTPLASALAGAWAPDGRDTDPTLVLDMDSRPATLSAFNGLDPNGRWTLFIADVDSLYASTLANWTLRVRGTNALPLVTVPPQSRTNIAGTEALFSVTATGLSTLHYQWYFGATPIAGATNAAFSLAHVETTNAGSYSVVVTTLGGSVASAAATLKVQTLQISGQVALDGYVGPARNGFGTRMVTFKALHSGSTVGTWDASLNFSPALSGQSVANFSLDSVPWTTTHLSAKTAWSLGQRLPVIFAGRVTVVDFAAAGALRGGDLDGSNAVDLADYYRLAASWYLPDPAADIDGSGMVDLDDYFILSNHWLETGDPE